MCRSEFRPGFTRCEECDADLVAEQPKIPVIGWTERVTVYETTQPSDALFVSSLLEGNGYSTLVHNDYVTTWMFGMPTPAIPLRISVAEGDSVAAASIIEEMRTIQPAANPISTARNRKWLVALAILVPGMSSGGIFLGSTGAFASAGAWAALALGLILDLRDRFPVPTLSEGRICLFFLLGSASAIGVIFLPLPVEALGIERNTALHAFLFIGPVEEIAKLLPVLIAMTIADRRRPFSWIVAAASSGAGFGMVENLFKFTISRGSEDAFIASSTGLLHPLLTALIGYGIARHGWFGGGLGLLAAAFLHGAWDALAFSDLWIVCLGLLAVFAWVYFANVDRCLVGVPKEEGGLVA
jgi:hypothetical protein